MNRPMRIRQRVSELIDVAREGDSASRIIDISMMVLISLNVFAVILETVPAIRMPLRSVFSIFEAFSIAVFSLEYVLRLWTAGLKPRFARPVTGILRYMLTPMAVVDLLSILPFYLPLVSRFDLRMLRALRLLRLFRAAKAGRYSESLVMLGEVFRHKRAELWITTVIVIILIVISSSLMFFIENTAQPDKFDSIPATMWWCVSAITSVGYGDVVPVTPLGKLLGSIVALLGVGLFALPAGILASGFDEILRRKHSVREQHLPDADRDRPGHCPGCGRLLG
jgi:voltage-gated potassium channel